MRYALIVSLFCIALCATAEPVAGDMDQTGSVNATDVQLVINGALALPVAYPTDVDYSGQTNAVDIQLVVNGALGLPIDADGDGLCDSGEGIKGCACFFWDTDGDTVGDGQEMLDGTDPLDPNDRARTNLLMTYSDENWSCAIEGQTLALEMFTKKVTVRLPSDDTSALETWLLSEPLAKQPPVVDIISPDNTATIKLLPDATESEIRDLLGRLTASGLLYYAAPMFAEPSIRIVLTDELIVQFKSGYSTEAIESFINDNRARILQRDFLWPKCYVLGFTSLGGNNSLAVARVFAASEMVEYAHPNFGNLTEPPQPPFEVYEDDDDPPFVLYPNTFEEYEYIDEAIPLATGWMTIAEEDFEDPNIFNGALWSNGDFDAERGAYYWGRISDVDYPTFLGEYVPEGFKGWASAAHAVGFPDFWPDQNPPEPYAKSMDAWLTYGPFDLSDAYWARLWFRFKLRAMPGELFEVLVSLNGAVYDGVSIEPPENSFYYIGKWAYNDEDHPRKSVLIDLTNVPNMGDVTRAPNVWIAFRFKSDGVANTQYFVDSHPLRHGVYIDDIRLERSNLYPAAGLTADHLSPMQWGLKNSGQAGGGSSDIDVEDAWDYVATTAGPDAITNGIIVAVLDEGVDLAHADLNLVPGFDATFNEDYAVRYPDREGGPESWDGHGTACAGIIGALENAVGIAGVAPGVRIMPVRIAKSHEPGGRWYTTHDRMASGIVWAADNGARVLSNSWGGSTSDVLHEAIVYARNAGCTLVFASGNDNSPEVMNPAAHDEVIAVGAIAPNGDRKNPDSADGEWFWGSNYGDQLDIMAPGVLIATTDISGEDGYAPGDYFKSFNGTSSACPHVAGVAALMLTINPGLSPATVQAILQDTATDLGDPGWDVETGWGLVNAAAAVSQVPPPIDLQIQEWTADGEAPAGDSIDATFEVHNDSTAASGTFAAGVHFSSDTTYDGGDDVLFLGTYSLSAGETQTVSLELTIPAGAAPGSYSLILVVDTGGVIEETNEANNTSVEAFTVLEPPFISVKPTTVDFGSIPIGVEDSRYVHIKNESSTPLTVTGIAYSGDSAFSLNTPGLPVTVGAWSEQLFEVLFLPASAGVFSGSVTVASNDPDDPEVEVSLLGSGASPASPIIRIYPQSVVFGTTATSKTFSVSNDGNGTASWTITDDLPDWLGVSPMAGDSSAKSGVPVTASISRTGLANGVYTHDLSLTSNGGNATVLVAMTVGETPAGWSKTYGALGWEHTHNCDMIHPTRDGGYIMAANTSSFGAGNDDLWVVKLAGTGVVEWETAYGGSSIDHASGIAPTADGGYILVGESYSFRTGTRYCDAWAWKLTATGSVEWQKTCGGTNYDHFESVRQTSDGGYLFAGQTVSFGAGNRDLWLVRVDATGGIVWEKTYGGGASEFLRAIEATAAGGYIVAASTESFGAGGIDFWVLEIDDEGAIVWERAYGGGGSETPNGVVQLEDGGFAVGGHTSSFGAGGTDFWVVALDEDGDIVWQKVCGGTANETSTSLCATEDGGFVITGWTYSFGSESNDGWVVKFHPAGTIEWQKRYNNDWTSEIDNADWLYDASLAYDGGLVLLGESNWEGAANGDVWVLKVGPDGTLGCGVETATAAVVEDTTGTAAITSAIVSVSSANVADSPGVTEATSATVQVVCAH